MPRPGVDARFLRYQLQTRVAELQASGSGRTFLELSGTALGRVAVVGAPAEAQRRIVDFLDRECERVAALATTTDAFDARLRELEAADLAELFAGSPMTRLGWTATVQTGVTLGKDYSSDPTAKEYPYLRVANVLADSITLDDVATVVVSSDVAARTRLQTGDVLMTEGGDIDKLGRGAMWDGRIKPCLHQNHVFAVRRGPALVPEVLALWTRAPAARAYFERTASRITNIASTNVTKLRALPVPSLPIVEQHRRLDVFAAHAHDRRKLSSRSAALRERLAAYRDALIMEAVNGEIDVTGLSDAQMSERAHAAFEAAS